MPVLGRRFRSGEGEVCIPSLEPWIMPSKKCQGEALVNKQLAQERVCRTRGYGVQLARLVPDKTAHHDEWSDIQTSIGWISDCGHIRARSRMMASGARSPKSARGHS